jgi:hypothetical protein
MPDRSSTIHLEGALLPSDFIERIAQGDKDVPGLRTADYHLASDDRINEVISQAWNRALGFWAAFRKATAGLPESDTGTSQTRERWLLPLFNELGYGRLQVQRQTVIINEREYPISHFWQKIPIHLVGCRLDLDHQSPQAVGRAQKKPHSILQEYLNREEASLWGFLSNGLTLRILRDSASIARQAYIEFDLEAMMEGEAYSDFAIFWLLCHQSRVEGDRPDQCWLEKWSQSARQAGIRALDNYRQGVQMAIEALGAGFVAHPANAALRDKLRRGPADGGLDKQDYYRQILRSVYRLIFLFVAEDRGVLLQPNAPTAAKDRYRQFYSTARLRRLAGAHRGTRHADLWNALALVIDQLKAGPGCPALALPSLGSFLWSPEATPDLNGAQVPNAHLLQAIRCLSFTEDRGVRRSVDFRNLGGEELGSVYESLLELHPDMDIEARVFSLATSAGNERKTSGSHYTPDSLVMCLIDSALEPVIRERLAAAKTQQDKERALLALKVLDPACGSGHFLIRAGHRLARHLAAVRTGEEAPSPEAYRQALRDVIGHCLYGVDINPMAVELCKINLWIEALEPGKPLSFLDHHIRVGNSLLGATPELLAKGIPDDAFNAIEGDDKKACVALRKRNKKERDDVSPLFIQEEQAIQEKLQEISAAVDQIPDTDIAGVHRKEEEFQKVQTNYDYMTRKRFSDAWCAAFVIHKTFKPGTTEPIGLTQRHLNELAKGRSLHGELGTEVDRLAKQYQFFHWHLAFSEVFANGGFDVIFGNPPWDMQEVKDNEFFAASFPEILSVKSAKDKASVLSRIREVAPNLFQAYQNYSRETYGQQHIMASSGRFPLSSAGRMNLYRLFLETGHTLVRRTGRVGIVIPSGFASDSFSQEHFSTLHGEGQLVSLYDFENRLGLFPGVHSSYRFCLLTIGGKGACTDTDFVFFAHSQPDLADADRHIRLSQHAVAALNPLTRTAPLFRLRRDYDLTLWMQQAGAIIGSSDGKDDWGIKQTLMFMMNAAMKGHRTAEELEAAKFQAEGNRYQRGEDTWLPFYEGKMVGMYDHRASSIQFDPSNRVRRNQPVALNAAEHEDPAQVALPVFWVNSTDVKERCSGVPRWCLCVKDVTSSTNERTSIAAMLAGVALSDSLPWLASPQSASRTACLLANLNSHAFDYLARQKVAGLHLRGHYLSQLTIISLRTYEALCPWPIQENQLNKWLVLRVLELTYTAWDLEPFAQDCGWSGPPFRWDEERRFLLRCELDAAFFHLYLPADARGQWIPARRDQGNVMDETPEQLAELKKHFPTPRHAVDYIMDTFPIVKRKDEAKYNGDYRTKRTILEIYDAMQAAIHTGKPYQTRLDPPPADPRCCHPPRSKDAKGVKDGR